MIEAIRCRACGEPLGRYDHLGTPHHVERLSKSPGGVNVFAEGHRFLPPRQPKPEPRQPSWDGYEYGEDAHGPWSDVEERYLEGWES